MAAAWMSRLGGSFVCKGGLDDLRPLGGFELRRGRFLVVGQRITFDEGIVTLEGNLDPRLNMVARTEAENGTIVTVTVGGRASDPQITFSAEPELPQDEALALLIFDRNLSELSAFQVAQLAAAVATLTGSGGNGVFDTLRRGVDLDNLDVTTAEDGSVGVAAGKYLRGKRVSGCRNLVERQLGSDDQPGYH